MFQYEYDNRLDDRIVEGHKKCILCHRFIKVDVVQEHFESCFNSLTPKVLIQDEIKMLRAPSPIVSNASVSFFGEDIPNIPLLMLIKHLGPLLSFREVGILLSVNRGWNLFSNHIIGATAPRLLEKLCNSIPKSVRLCSCRCLRNSIATKFSDLVHANKILNIKKIRIDIKTLTGKTIGIDIESVRQPDGSWPGVLENVVVGDVANYITETEGPPFSSYALVIDGKVGTKLMMHFDAPLITYFHRYNLIDDGSVKLDMVLLCRAMVRYCRFNSLAQYRFISQSRTINRRGTKIEVIGGPKLHTLYNNNRNERPRKRQRLTETIAFRIIPHTENFSHYY